MFVARYSYAIDAYYGDYTLSERRCVSKTGAEALLGTLASKEHIGKDDELSISEEIGFVAPDGTVWAFSDEGPEQVLSEAEAEANRL